MIIRRRIGDILLEAGMISQPNLEKALEEQRRTDEKLGKILIRLELITEEELLDCLASQLDIDRYSPERYPLELGMGDMIPAALAQRLQLVPLCMKGTMLLIAMPNPTDIDALEQVERLTGCEVEPVICTESSLAQLTSALYGNVGDFDQLLADIETPEQAKADEEAIHEVQAGTLANLAEGAPVVRMVNWVISQAVRMRASDIHLSPEKDFVQLRFRIDGQLRDMPSPPQGLFLPMISRIKLLARMDIAISRVPQDGRFTVRMNNREYNIRASSLPTVHGENMVLRLLDPESGPGSLESMDLDPAMHAEIRSLIHRPWGLILACGPTGSGKTTTLYTMLRELSGPNVNIMALEDPAEYRLPRIRQVQVNHRAGMTFAQGLRAMLRQDPDVIMVGEIRDTETAQIAVQAALTGHLVLSTIHTNDAVGAITRLVDMGVPPFLVGSVMQLAISQRLVRRICRSCGTTDEHPKPEMLRWLGLDPAARIPCRRGRGCNVCLEVGFLGRCGLFETLRFDEELRRGVSRGADTGQIAQLARERNLLRDLRADAARRVLEGTTTVEEAASAIMF
ncbi:MAG: GspE/PulE family protein [Lentisphaeria bacterium]|nr:GspE/PulE family protein [Lentisphaeria bacterium]